MTERNKLTADIDRRLLSIDQKIERTEARRQQTAEALADLYQTREALLAAGGALVRNATMEAAE